MATIVDTPRTAPDAPRLPARRVFASELRTRFALQNPDSYFWATSIASIAFVLRYLNVAAPNSALFDEAYYALDRSATKEPGFVAHPPLGKGLIELSEWLFGATPLGWRTASVLAGSISVFIMVRLARRLFGSMLLGCLAGLLLALDGLHFVASRVAMLDIFVTLFVLAAFVCLVIDRDARKAQILRASEAGAPASDAVRRGNEQALPRWRLAAAVLTGCALGVKWSAVWYLLFGFIPLVAIWEWNALHAVGVRWAHSGYSTRVRRALTATLWNEGMLALKFVSVVTVTYVLTWGGWFLSGNGWGRHWAERNHAGAWFIPDVLENLWHYHSAMYAFHSNVTWPHLYESAPLSWLLMQRPVALFYDSAAHCDRPPCVSEVLAAGTPVLWWAFVPALGLCLWRWFTLRDPRATTILIMVAAGILPWLCFPRRTMFLYYALPTLPFLVLAVTLALGIVLGSRAASRDRRRAGALLVGTYVLVVAMTFAYFHPLFTGEPIPYDAWRARIWIGSWV